MDRNTVILSVIFITKWHLHNIPQKYKNQAYAVICNTGTLWNKKIFYSVPEIAAVSVRPYVSTGLPKTVPCPSNPRLNLNGFRPARHQALVDDSVTAHIIKMATGMSQLRVTSLLRHWPVYRNINRTGSSFVSGGIYTAAIRIEMIPRL